MTDSEIQEYLKINLGETINLYTRWLYYLTSIEDEGHHVEFKRCAGCYCLYQYKTGNADREGTYHSNNLTPERLTILIEALNYKIRITIDEHADINYSKKFINDRVALMCKQFDCKIDIEEEYYDNAIVLVYNLVSNSSLCQNTTTTLLPLAGQAIMVQAHRATMSMNVAIP